MFKFESLGRDLNPRLLAYKATERPFFGRRVCALAAELPRHGLWAG